LDAKFETEVHARLDTVIDIDDLLKGKTKKMDTWAPNPTHERVEKLEQLFRSCNMLNNHLIDTSHHMPSLKENYHLSSTYEIVFNISKWAIQLLMQGNLHIMGMKGVGQQDEFPIMNHFSF